MTKQKPEKSKVLGVGICIVPNRKNTQGGAFYDICIDREGFLEGVNVEELELEAFDGLKRIGGIILKKGEAVNQVFIYNDNKEKKINNEISQKEDYIEDLNENILALTEEKYSKDEALEETDRKINNAISELQEQLIYLENLKNSKTRKREK